MKSTNRSDLPENLEMYRQVASAKYLLLIYHHQNQENYLKNEGRVAYIQIVNDGIHPNLKGYKKILLPELQKNLNQ